MKPKREAPAQEVRALVQSCGFDRVAFAAADRAAGTDRFLEWLNRGYAGDMTYLTRQCERRGDPRCVLPGARTVIVTALFYRAPSPFGVAEPRADRAELASYARGTDYHRVLDSRLRKASSKLGERYEAAYRYYVDTGPVLEKDWAAQAGIGWLGKNACAIDPHFGSFFFLGTILTTLQIPPDSPATDHCGSCSLCLEACPTGALVEPYVLDARRCISYLTIEHRKEIASELEERMANLVFGCDICQEVCPWNDPERLRGDPELAPRPENEFPSLAELAALDEQTFRIRFRQSAVKRAKHRGLLRNTLIALGNSGRPELLQLLRELVLDKTVAGDPVLRDTAYRAIRRLEATTPPPDNIISPPPAT